MTDYQFTKDWFGWAPPVWEQIIPMLPGEPGKRNFLEIGSFEGRSMVWTVENMMAEGDHLDCIDTWQGGEEHSAEDMAAVEARFDHNLALLEQLSPTVEIEKLRGSSVAHLGGMVAGLDRGTWLYDFIYIDGSHIAKDVLTDACMAWPLLKSGGIMVFDDYMWGNPRDILHRPKPAIDAFTNIFAEEAEIIHVGYQLIIRKTRRC
jgi:predicted O-methyltransferase YrrM